MPRNFYGNFEDFLEIAVFFWEKIVNFFIWGHFGLSIFLCSCCVFQKFSFDDATFAYFVFGQSKTESFRVPAFACIASLCSATRFARSYSLLSEIYCFIIA